MNFKSFIEATGKLSSNYDEMIEHSIQRLKKHQTLVGLFINKASLRYPYSSELEIIKEQHDVSKNVDPELVPYVFINWKYKCSADGKEFLIDDEMQKLMHEATWHHIKTNKHHPEYWDISL